MVHRFSSSSEINISMGQCKNSKKKKTKKRSVIIQRPYQDILEKTQAKNYTGIIQKLLENCNQKRKFNDQTV